ncbi:hypothetical protein MesoLj113c_26580 [Mesorhizobium sp. 113-3-9]|nr:hypothetical protein MesoLj113c_26580 [Mesorhizobium sp. 113-3-9]
MVKIRAKAAIGKPLLGMLLGGLLLGVIGWGIGRPDDEEVMARNSAGAAIVHQLSGTNSRP